MERTPMVDTSLMITAPSRLHFGMLSFGWPGRRQYGGVGAMLARPLRITITGAPALCAKGKHAERAVRFARKWAHTCLDGNEPACQIEIETAPEDHVGLGSGTQLALAVAAGLYTLHEQPMPAADVLATSVGRGGRSAVGTYGFLHGGLIAEIGRMANQELAELHKRVEIPGDWRFVIIQPHDRQGVHGEDESRAFLKLPPVPTATTESLWEELDQRLLPALERSDFEQFGESVFRYGTLAGNCFARIQGGAYSTPKAGDLVSQIRALGFPGVGQSSWGPTLFAVARSEDDANTLVAKLAENHPEVRTEVCAPNNEGWQCKTLAV